MPILAAGSQAASWGIMVLYVVLIIGFMYFLAIKPQKKQEKTERSYDAVAVGDSILTTSGFYGMVIDVTDDTVIVEFGGNKNCRIPMQKSAIVDVEKAE